MSIEVHILDGPLAAQPARIHIPGAGAVLVFDGIVRAREGDGTIAALNYQTYEPMAQQMLAQIGTDLLRKHGLLALHVWHSRGRVGVGEISFRLLIASPHRKEGLAAMDEFIDLLKRDVPIWKAPVWAENPARASSVSEP